MSTVETPLPEAPRHLASEPVTLHFAYTVPGDAVRGFVPFYHYRTLVAGSDVGHINLRVGETEHVQRVAGHIGFEVDAPFRGHRYALFACRALAPFARTIAPAHLLTCDPDNLASRRTIELLGALFIDELLVPPNDPHYARGSKTKLRFQWTP